jgi:hypothetical protein
MTALAIVIFIVFVGWFLVQWRKLPRRYVDQNHYQDYDPLFHDFRAIPGTDLEECVVPGCPARQRR